MYQQTKETPVTGLLGPGIELPKLKPRKRVRKRVKRGRYAWVADALRKGMKKYRYRAYGEMYEYSEDGTVIAACALGAAQEFIPETNPVWSDPVNCPIDGEICALAGVIVNLNDDEGWNRGRIARWLETLE